MYYQEGGNKIDWWANWWESHSDNRSHGQKSGEGTWNEITDSRSHGKERGGGTWSGSAWRPDESRLEGKKSSDSPWRPPPREPGGPPPSTSAETKANVLAALSTAGDAATAVAAASSSGTYYPPLRPLDAVEPHPMLAVAAQKLDKDFFTNFSAFTDHSKQHNAALKWLRAENENAAFPFQSAEVVLPRLQRVAAVVHGSGTDFAFDQDSIREWYWLELVAQLDEESRNIVFGESDELVACSFAVRPKSYDHQRQSHHRSRGDTMPKLPIWDFVIHRMDGTYIRLHPHWNDLKVDAFRAAGFEEDVEPPQKGLGAADYKGHFAEYRRKMNDGIVLRFDALRKPHGSTFYIGKQKPRSKAKAKT
jgi:hypothetical protein